MAGKQTTKAAPAKVAKTVKSDEPEVEETAANVRVSAVPMALVKEIQPMLESDHDIQITLKDLKTILEVFVKTTVEKVLSGTPVTFTKHFTLKRVLRNARTHINPSDKTGESKIQKPAHYVLSMDVKPNLKEIFENEEVDKKELKELKEKEANRKAKAAARAAAKDADSEPEVEEEKPKKGKKSSKKVAEPESEAEVEEEKPKKATKKVAKKAAKKEEAYEDDE